MTRSLSRFFLLWTLLFMLLFPCFFSFPHHIIPDYGALISSLLSTPLNWIGEYVFNLSAEQAARRISDSRGFYVAAACALAFSMIPAILLVRRTFSEKLTQLLLVYLRYFIAWYLFSYAFSKLFKYQFYFPEPNTLFTNVGTLNRDILYWSTMGVSHSYNILSGSTELLAAILLLFRRTFFAGALLAFLLLGNIVAINFSYDISVKLFSSFLLLGTGVLLLSRWKKVRSLVSDTGYLPETVAKFDFMQTQASRIAKFCILLLLLADTLFPYVRFNSWNGDNAEKPVLFGAYEVVSLNRNVPWKRAFYHSQDYFIVQYPDESMQDFDAAFDEEKELLILQSDKEMFELECRIENRGDLMLKGKFRDELINMKLIKISLDSLPLSKREFNLFLD